MFWATDAISIKVKLGGAAATTELPITGCYTEVGATGSIVGFGNIHAITTGGTAVSVVGVASSGNLRKLQGLRLVNVDTAAATVTVYQDDGTARNAIVVTLAVGYQLNVFDSGAWEVRDANGAVSGSGGAPTDADYLVKTSNSSLSAERVVTDTTPITWDWGTAGQAKALIAGATTLYGALDALTVTGSNIASASTTDIGAATGESVTITGTTTITGLGTKAAGCLRFVTFSGALTLTYNATSLILPTAANITTAAGDTAIFVSLGSGNWKCLSYTRASGTALSSSSSTVPYVKLQEQQSSGTDAGTFTSGAQRTRVLNTETDPSSLCTLSSNQFVLASGTWEILAFAPASYVNYHQAFLRNVTSGTNELVGSTEFTINGGAVAIDTNSVLMGRFTSNGTDSYEIQHRCSATQATNGFGAGSGNTWGNVVFTQVMLWKVA
jgi:hypothetical protein